MSDLANRMLAATGDHPDLETACTALAAAYQAAHDAAQASDDPMSVYGHFSDAIAWPLAGIAPGSLEGPPDLSGEPPEAMVVLSHVFGLRNWCLADSLAQEEQNAWTTDDGHSIVVLKMKSEDYALLKSLASGD